MMRKLFFAAAAFAVLCSCAGSVTAPRDLVSPDKTVILKQLDGGDLSFELYADGSKVLGIPQVGIDLDGVGKLQPMKFKGPEKIVDDYVMLTGKRRECNNEANEYVYSFSTDGGATMDLVMRVYNDGLAFRYVFKGLESATLDSELTRYHVGEGNRRWMQPFNNAYEDFYPMTVSEEGHERRIGYPSLVQADTNAWALISEAGIGRGNSASNMKTVEGESGTYSVFMDRLPIELDGTWSSPWRVVIAGSLAEVVESTLITDVSEPEAFDASWVKPGGVSWIYWAYNRGSKDYQIVKSYVNMASQLNLPYVLIDWEWDVMGNGGDIDDALAYADSLGVKTLLWYNSSTEWVGEGAFGPLYRLNSPENREAEFSMLEKRGVAGVKIDFFSGDTYETMDYCLDLLEDAAKHHLLVNFHGATVPRGWQRTYPNMMTVEGVYGAEWYNNNARLTTCAAAHNATLPFTRNVVGPMDYTPCTFSDSQHPHITTHSHEAALPVVFESALTHWADRPSSYLSQSGMFKEFMRELPTVWDETRLLGGYPSESVIMARRSGDKWYVGGLNGLDEAVTLDIDWAVLGVEPSEIIVFDDAHEDGAAVENLPSSIDCAPRSGFVVILS